MAQFGDGGGVSKITLPGDFSTVRIQGLPLDSARTSVSALVREVGFELPPECVRVLFKPPEAATASADVKVDDPSFARRFCAKLKAETGRGTHPGLNGLEALPAPTAAFLSGSTSRRVSCKKVHVSWHKPVRTVWLNFGKPERAERVSTKFNKGVYTIAGQTIGAGPPKHSPGGRCRRNPVAWTVALKGVPLSATSNDIERAISAGYDRPRHIELSESGSSNKFCDLNTTSAVVKTLLTSLGSAEFETIPSLQGKRFKAIARFDEEADAREAVHTLHNKHQDFLNGGKLTVQLVSSAKFKVPTTTYDALEGQFSKKSADWTARHIRFKVYRNTDTLQRFTTLRIEGEQTKDVASVTNTVEEILAGETVKDGDAPLWSAALAGNGTAYQKLKLIQHNHGVVVIRNKTKRQLKFVGPPEKYQQVQQDLVDLLKTQSTTAHIITLGPHSLAWMCKGGFKQVATALGDNVASLDIVSKPQRVIITGSEKQHQIALAIIQGKTDAIQPSETSATDQEDCTVCWTEAESPILTKCKHSYCLECFENLCTAASCNDNPFSITCQGEMGKCRQIFSLRELQDHLSSTIFEDVLEASFVSHIRRNPQSFHYCPTPDCGYIYRSTTTTQNNNTCPKCLEVICTACHSQHAAMSCADYKYLNSSGYAAFKKLKREWGIKDCPKCSTSMEKTEGCNHMTCGGCGAHICWVCLKTFAESGPCYKHMSEAHGGCLDIGFVI